MKDSKDGGRSQLSISPLCFILTFRSNGAVFPSQRIDFPLGVSSGVV